MQLHKRLLAVGCSGQLSESSGHWHVRCDYLCPTKRGAEVHKDTLLSAGCALRWYEGSSSGRFKHPSGNKSRHTAP
jgi:hypothetical protein